METALTIVELLIGLVLIIIVLFQAKGTSASVFGGQSSSAYRTRRGLEKTLYNLTIGLAVVFVLVSLFHPLLIRR